MSTAQLMQPATNPFEQHDLPPIVADLLAGGALTEYQATWLAERWPDLPDDWAANPYLRSVREHSRAYINHYRRLEHKAGLLERS
jgi:hypothetical protein